MARICKKQLNCVGHNIKKEGLEKLTISWHMEGRYLTSLSECGAEHRTGGLANEVTLLRDRKLQITNQPRPEWTQRIDTEFYFRIAVEVLYTIFNFFVCVIHVRVCG